MAEKVLYDYPDVLEALTLVASSGGVFEVTLDGELIFSKEQQGRFPDDDEITPRLDARRRSR